MPLVRLNIIEGRSDAEIVALLDAAHEAVVEAFQVPQGDRYQIVSEYKIGRLHALDTGLNLPRTDKLIIVEVTSRARPKELKTAFYELLCQKLKTACEVESTDVIVSVVENGDADWSFGRGRAQFLTGELD